MSRQPRRQTARIEIAIELEIEPAGDSELLTPDASSDSCPDCDGGLEAERSDAGECYVLVCQVCGSVCAVWEPGMPDWELR